MNTPSQAQVETPKVSSADLDSYINDGSGDAKLMALELVKLRAIVSRESRSAYQIRKLRWQVENLLVKVEQMRDEAPSDLVVTGDAFDESPIDRREAHRLVSEATR